MDTLRMWQHLLAVDNPPPQAAIESYRQGVMFGKMGRWGDAEPLLAGALKPLEAAAAPEAAPANNNLAVLHQERGEFDGAVYHAVRAVFLYNKNKDLGGIYVSLHNLAVIHSARGETYLADASQLQAGRARRELIRVGLGQLAEQGFDCRGEQLRMLGPVSIAQAPAKAG